LGGLIVLTAVEVTVKTTGTTQRSVLCRLSVVALAVMGLASPAAASSFTFAIGSPVGTPSCGSTSDSGSTPVSGSLVCSPIGGASLLDASAAASFGYTGGSTIAAVGAGYFGTAYGIGTQSTFSDYVTFTSLDPTVTSVLVSANLAFSGTLNATASGGASVSLFYHLGGVTGFMWFGADTNTGVTRNDFGVASGSVSTTSSNALLNTGTYLAPVNTPLLMTLTLSTFAGVGGGGSPASASSLFSNSFQIPIGIDAFVLPSGVTANAGTWLVNNRRVGVDEEASVVPEPGTWTLVALGLCCGSAMLRRRRGASSS
jgi:hypothetical protein